MIMSSERGSMSLSKLDESSSLTFPMFTHLVPLSLSLSLKFILSLCLPPSAPPLLQPLLLLHGLALPFFFFIVLKALGTNYQKGHFHLWTAGLNRYLFHAFKIKPVLLLSVWFVYFALEYSFSGKELDAEGEGGEWNARPGMQFTLNLRYIGFLHWLIKHAKRTFP